MATLHDFIEITGFSSNTDYLATNGDILGVFDNVTWGGSGDMDIGDSVTIDGTVYSINEIYEPSSGSSVDIHSDEGITSLNAGSESDLEVMMLELSGPGGPRYFVLPNDSYGDFTNINQIDLGNINTVAGNDASIAATTDNAVTAVCFSADTLIETENGAQMRAADLRAGDLVMTADHGLQKVRWAMTKTLTAKMLADNPNLYPVRLRAGVLDGQRPDQDLLVSPLHRILVRSKIAQRMFNSAEVLIAAKELTALDGVEIACDVGTVTYCHFMFERHEIVFANGAPAESLFTGPVALKSISKASKDEVFHLFPELAEVDFKALPIRILAKGKLGRKLAFRHKKNQKTLLDQQLPFQYIDPEQQNDQVM